MGADHLRLMHALPSSETPGRMRHATIALLPLFKGWCGRYVTLVMQHHFASPDRPLSCLVYIHSLALTLDRCTHTTLLKDFCCNDLSIDA